MTLLALKLLLVPAIIAVISFIGKRWGPEVAGWLAGFPTIVISVLIILAIERGPDFAAAAATTALLAMSSTSVFCVAYAWACLRMGWFSASIVSLSVWIVVALCLFQLPTSPYLFLGIAMVAMFGGLRCFPKVPVEETRASSVRDVPLRMICGVALTLLVTGLAKVIGPAWSGLLAGFPVLLIILPVFFQRSHGPAFVVRFLRSAVAGFYSYAVLSFMLAVMLPRWGSAVSFPVAIPVALLVQWASKKRSA